MNLIARRFTLGAGLVLIAACSRAPLREDVASSTGDGASGVGGSGAEGVGGAGATGAAGMGANGGTGGVAPPCDGLVWAGDPVLVPATVGITARRPRLVRVSVVRLGLVFESAVFDATLLASAFVDPWNAWPPDVGAVDANFPLAPPWTRFAVSWGEPDRFAFAAQQAGSMVLGQATPGQNGSSFVDWPAGNDEPKALARSNAGSYLVARGPETGVVVELLPGYFPDPVPLQVGAFGCASPFVVADAVAVDGGDFLVAHTSDLPFDDCSDPDLPDLPRYVQTWRVGAGGAVPGAFFEEAVPVFDLSLSGRIGGAWLTYRADGDPTVHVLQLDEQGQVVQDFSSTGNATDRDHTIAWFDGFARATTSAGDATGTVSLEVFDGTSLEGLEMPLMLPTGRPSIASSPDGGSFLIAVEHGLDSGSDVVLMRADCASD